MFIDTSRQLPVGDVLTDSLLGPAVVARAGKNFTSYVDKAQWRNTRNMHEAQSLATILDEMLRMDIPITSMLFETTARRLAAVEAADRYNNWDLANAIDIAGSNGSGLLPLAALDSYARNVTRVNSLYRRTFNATQPFDNTYNAQPQRYQYAQQQQSHPPPLQQKQQPQQQQQSRNFSRGPWTTPSNNNTNNNNNTNTTTREANRARPTSSTTTTASAGPTTGISNNQ